MGRPSHFSLTTNTPHSGEPHPPRPAHPPPPASASRTLSGSPNPLRRQGSRPLRLPNPLRLRSCYIERSRERREKNWCLPKMPRRERERERWREHGCSEAAGSSLRPPHSGLRLLPSSSNATARPAPAAATGERRISCPSCRRNRTILNVKKVAIRRLRAQLTRMIEISTVPSPLIWEIVKKNNVFLVKLFGNGNATVQFSKEGNNLYNVNSFKHSGLANKKTVSINPGGKDLSVVL